MKMSPEELPATPPMRPTPSAARFAIRFSWWGRSGPSGERRSALLLRPVAPFDAARPPSPALSPPRQRPPVTPRPPPPHAPLDHGVSHHADRVGVRDHYGAPEKAGLLDPGRARHLAV